MTSISFARRIRGLRASKIEEILEVATSPTVISSAGVKPAPGYLPADDPGMIAGVAAVESHGLVGVGADDEA